MFIISNIFFLECCVYIWNFDYVEFNINKYMEIINI